MYLRTHFGCFYILGQTYRMIILRVIKAGAVHMILSVFSRILFEQDILQILRNMRSSISNINNLVRFIAYSERQLNALKFQQSFREKWLKELQSLCLRSDCGLLSRSNLGPCSN